MASTPIDRVHRAARVGDRNAVEIAAATEEMDGRVVAARRRRIDVLSAQSSDRRAAAQRYWEELVADLAAELPQTVRAGESQLAAARSVETADLQARVRAAAELLALRPPSFEPFRPAASVALGVRRGTYCAVARQYRAAQAELDGYSDRHAGVEQVILRQRRRDLHELEGHLERLADELTRLGGQVDQLEGRVAAIDARTIQRQQWLLDRFDELAAGAAAARVLAERGVLRLDPSGAGRAGKGSELNGRHADSARITGVPRGAGEGGP